MKFEELISKYLDSELTPAEDNELREIISENPLMKQEFNEYVELHYILKKDAQNDLLEDEEFENIEDNLLMHILVDQNKETKRSYAVNYKSVLTPVLSIFLVFFISIYNIFDVKLTGDSAPFAYNLMIPNGNLQNLQNENIILESNNDISNINTISDESQSNFELASLSNMENSNFVSENSNDDISEVNDSDVLQTNLKLNENNESIVLESNDNIIENKFENINTNVIDRSNIISNENTLSSQYINQESMYLNMNYQQPNLKIKDLVFESNVFSDFSRTGFSPIDEKKMNSFAQSAAIKVSEKTKIGLELGVSEYEFRIQKDITVPYNEVSSFDGDLSNGRRLPSGIRTQITTNIIYDNYFADVFIDSRLYESNYFSINGRTGLGISNGGMLITGRLYADIPIFGALHLITGIDGRVFQNDNIFYNQNGVFNTNMSIVNGLYFSF